MKQREPKEQEMMICKSTSILINIMYIVSVITTSPFYYRTHLFTDPSPLPIQAVNAISIFGNDKKSIVAVFLSCECS